MCLLKALDRLEIKSNSFCLQNQKWENRFFAQSRTRWKMQKTICNKKTNRLILSAQLASRKFWFCVPQYKIEAKIFKSSSLLWIDYNPFCSVCITYSVNNDAKWIQNHFYFYKQIYWVLMSFLENITFELVVFNFRLKIPHLLPENSVVDNFQRFLIAKSRSQTQRVKSISVVRLSGLLEFEENVRSRFNRITRICA